MYFLYSGLKCELASDHSRGLISRGTITVSLSCHLLKCDHHITDVSFSIGVSHTYAIQTVGLLYINGVKTIV